MFTIKNIRYAALFFTAMFLIITACRKEGSYVPAPQVTEAQVKVFSPNPDERFMSFIDDVKIGDTIGVGGAGTRIVVKKEEAQHLVVKNLTTGRIMIDTMLVLQKPSCTFSVVQLDATGSTKPLLYASGGEVSEIPEDSARFSFYIADPVITEPVDIYLYQGDLNSYTVKREPVHIFRNVSNYSSTDFAMVDMKDGNIWYTLEIRRSSTGELLPEILNNEVRFDDPFSGITANVCITPGNGVPANVSSIFTLQGFSGFYVSICTIFF